MSMNLDSNDIVGSLGEFESLENIQRELDMLNHTNENVRVVRTEDMEIMPTIITKDEEDIKAETMDDEDDEQEDDDCIEAINAHMNDAMTDEMIEGNVNEIMQVMEMHGDDVEMQDLHEAMEDQGEFGHDPEDVNGSDDQHQLFSEGVIGDEEIIDDSQVITEDVGDVHRILTGDQIHDEQILMDSEVKYLDDIMNDDVNETIIEAEEVEDRTGDVFHCEDDEENQTPTIISMSQLPEGMVANVDAEIITGDKNFDDTQDRNDFITVKFESGEMKVLKAPKIEKQQTSPGILTVEPAMPPLVVSKPSDAQVQEAVKSISQGVFVVSSAGSAPLSQTIIQSGGTLIAPRDAKIQRVMTIPNIDTTSGQTIRIVAPPGKFNSTAKAITLAQARQMGLISPSGRIISNILPSTAKPAAPQTISMNKLVVPGPKKTVTVVKSPTKILPAPPPNVGHKPQKVLIRQANSLKTGTLLASGSGAHPPGTQMIRIPANQTIQQILPGGSKQVQYVKLVNTGGPGKGQTLVPVSLNKSIPVLTTNIINSPAATFKVVPISTQSGTTSLAHTTTPGQRVLIPASAVSATQSLNSPSQIVMLPSHLIHQVRKGDNKLLPAVSTANMPALRPTTTYNGSRKVVPAPPVPPLKVREQFPAVATSTPVRTVSSTPATTSPSDPPPLLPTPATTPPSPPAQTSPVGPSSSVGGSTCSSPTPATNSMNMGVPQPKIEMKQDPWSGDESYLEANGIRPRKPCNCTKSMCLKLYCDCFANGEFCYQCNCTCCYNNLDHEEERQRAIKSCLERNSSAFRPKIGKTLTGSEERRHNKGCNCKRSGCLKNYCECFEAKIPCSKNCKCAGCRNTDSYLGKRGGDDERSRYKMDAKPFENTGHMYSSACRQAFSMMSPELIQATCKCLIAQAEKWDKTDDEQGCEEAKKLIIEEFGHCLVQIIDCVTKSIPQQSPMSSNT